MRRPWNGLWRARAGADRAPATPAAADDLTIVIPTHNRSVQCRSLLRFLRAGSRTGPIMIADSSDGEHAGRNRSVCESLGVAYRQYPPAIGFCEKMIDALAAVGTPFATMAPDDDLVLPDAIAECRTFLADHEDYVAAWGYVLEFANHSGQVDIHTVRWYTPSIDEDRPLDRVYHLIRRYQPFFWSVVRTAAVREAMSRASVAGRTVFQELTATLSIALAGKVARLPVVYALRGTERSQYRLSDTHPLYALMGDADAFLREYDRYRARLCEYASGQASDLAHGTSLKQFFDLVHLVGLARELDGGVVNHTVQRALGARLPEAPGRPDDRRPALPPGRGDMAHPSRHAGRRYIWRRAVLEAEPRSEVTITAEQIAAVEAQLDDWPG